MIKIVEKKAQANEIEKYFVKNEQIFTASLSLKVSIAGFSAKIFENAIQFWAFNGRRKVGFIACYFNNPQKEFGYITTISVIEPFQGKGIGKKLLNKAIEYGRQNEFKKIVLEVNHNNILAINLYKTFGFNIINKKKDGYLMELLIT